MDDYASIARFYDAALASFLPAARLAVTERICAQLAPVSGTGPAVLDLGCGTGLQMRHLARHGIAVTGVDISAAMLGRAYVALERAERQNPAVAGLCTLAYACADQLPFADGAFKLALLLLLLHESASSPFRLLDEALRVAPRLLILDWRIPERNLDYPAHFLGSFIECCAGRRHFASFRAFMRLGGLEGLMQRYSVYRRKNSLHPCAITRRESVAFGALLLMDVELS